MPESVFCNDQALTHRERFRRLMHFQTVDRGVHWEFGYLKETWQRWHTEGLPEELADHATIERYFGRDPHAWVPIVNKFDPPFTGDVEVLEQKQNSRVVKTPMGQILEEVTKGQTTIPHYIKFPIENRADWERIKERLDPDSPGRQQTDYVKLGKELQRSELPVGISLGSFFGWVRDWVGFENLCLMCYDDRELVEEMCTHLAELFYRQLERALPHVEVDFAAGWEDICFRNGPMISPAMFREIVIPGVKKVCDLLREHGVDIIWTDCDGDIRPLVPLWLEAGLNTMFPLEVFPGSDPVELRQTYGHRILLVGGIEKHKLAGTKEDVLAELKRIEPVLHDGGYIPHCDHRVPNDVPYDNYRYYIREKMSMLGFSQAEIAEVPGLKG